MIKELTKAGWVLLRTTGGHDVYVCNHGRIRMPVPRHTMLSPTVVRNIRNGITRCNNGE